MAVTKRPSDGADTRTSCPASVDELPLNVVAVGLGFGPPRDGL